MRVTTDLAAGTTGLVSGLAPGAPAGASFAAKLADATDSTATTETSAKAETTRKVPGHSYEEIISGPRNGMFINRSGNTRDGQAFTIVKRKDHELHVYGSGKNREVVVAPRAGHKETTKPVDGHAGYVEVTAGPRNGMYINMTDNERRGQAFVLVKKDDHDLHIYGTGEHRRVIVSWHAAQDGDDASKTDKPEKTGASGTGGAAAEL